MREFSSMTPTFFADGFGSLPYRFGPSVCQKLMSFGRNVGDSESSATRKPGTDKQPAHVALSQVIFNFVSGVFVEMKDFFNIIEALECELYSPVFDEAFQCEQNIPCAIGIEFQGYTPPFDLRLQHRFPN